MTKINVFEIAKEIKRDMDQLKLYDMEVAIADETHSSVKKPILQKRKEAVTRIANNRHLIYLADGAMQFETEADEILYKRRAKLAIAKPEEQLTVFLLRELTLAKVPNHQTYSFTPKEESLRKMAMEVDCDLLAIDTSHMKIGYLYLDALLRHLADQYGTKDTHPQINKVILAWQEACGLKVTKENKPYTSRSNRSGRYDSFLRPEFVFKNSHNTQVNYLFFAVDVLEEGLTKHFASFLHDLI